MASASASAPAVGRDKPALSPGTTYRLALWTTDPSISLLGVVLTGSSGEAKVSLADGPTCKWVWSSVQGAAHNAGKDQRDVYDLIVPDVGDISSVKIEFDVTSAKTKGMLGIGTKIDDYNFKNVQVLRVSGMRVLLFTNPNPEKLMGEKKPFVQMSPSEMPAGAVPDASIPTVIQVPQAAGASDAAASAGVGAASGGAAAASKMSTLIVSVRTKTDSGVRQGCGTDGRVSVKFHGGAGVETPVFELDQLKICDEEFHVSSVTDNPNPKDEVKWRKAGKYFQQSQESFFRIVTQLPDNFGAISAVTVSHDAPKQMLGGVDAWVPKYVAVTQDLPDGTSAYRSFEFPDKTEMNKKLMSIHLKDFTTERPKRGADFVTATVKKTGELAKSVVNSVVPADLVRPKKNWDEKSKEYVIEVKTADTLGAGTDSDVEVTLVGNVADCVVVLKEHPYNPARLEAEEPGKDLFEQHSLDRFIISIPNARAIGDQINKIKVRLPNSKPEWDKSQGVGKSLAEGLQTGLAIVTRDKWVPSYIRIVDYERPEGQNEFYFAFDAGKELGRGDKHFEVNVGKPIETFPEPPQPATEEHQFVHIHDTNDPGVEKPEPKGFFGFGKKKEEDKKSKEQDAAGKGEDAALPPKKDDAAAGSSRRKSVMEKAMEKVGVKSEAKEGDAKEGSEVAEEPEKGLGDEDDIDPDEKEAAVKEILKIPAEGEKKPIEKGPYRVYVQISEGRDLVGKKENLMAEPVFQISACGQKEITRNKKKKCRSLFVNQLFIFDFEQKESFDMDLAKIQISYLDGGSLFSTLLGSYEFDMSIIYHQDKHEIANVWVALLDASGESLDIKGFVKLSIAVVGENDELPVHNDDDEDEEAGMDMTQCLMPPNMETKKNSLTIVCLKGQGFPQLSTSNMEFFAEAAYGVKRARTNKDTMHKLSPEWHEALRLPFVTPTMANDIAISFKNSRRGGKNQTVGTLHVSLKDVMTAVAPDGSVTKPSKYAHPCHCRIEKV